LIDGEEVNDHYVYSVREAPAHNCWRSPRRSRTRTALCAGKAGASSSAATCATTGSLIDADDDPSESFYAVRMRRFTALKAAAATLVASGVAGALVVHANRPGPVVRLVGDGPQILVVNRTTVAMAGVGLGGTVIYLPQEKCFVLDDTEILPPNARRPVGDAPTPQPTPTGGVHGMIWPYGSTPVHEGERRGVDIPGVGTVWDGDQLVGGGDAGPTSGVATREPSIPTDCLGHSVYEFLDIDYAHPPATSSPTATADRNEPLPWHAAGDPLGATLNLAIEGDVCAGPRDFAVTQSATEVSIRITARMEATTCRGVGTTETRSVTLDAPLGARTLRGCDPYHEPPRDCRAAEQL
jgi:hypothetical protein